MKMRCCRRRTAFSTWGQWIWLQSVRSTFHLRQWVSPSSTRLSRGSLVYRIVLHFFGNGGIWLHLEWPGTSPVSQALPRALAWSTILSNRFCTGWLSLIVGPVGVSVRDREYAYDSLSQFRDGYLRERRVRLRRPAGLLVTVDGPTGRPHHPQGCSPLRVNSAAEVIIDGPMPFAFANPLSLPACRSSSAVEVGAACRGLPTLSQATR